MTKQSLDRDKSLLAFCGNPDCDFNRFYDQAAILSGKVSYRDGSRNPARIITRKLYVGISGKGAVWFCSDCAAAIERNKSAAGAVSVGSELGTRSSFFPLKH